MLYLYTIMSTILKSRFVERKPKYVCDRFYYCLWEKEKGQGQKQRNKEILRWPTTVSRQNHSALQGMVEAATGCVL